MQDAPKTSTPVIPSTGPVPRRAARVGTSVRLLLALMTAAPLVAVVGAAGWAYLASSRTLSESRQRAVDTVASALAEPVRVLLDRNHPAPLSLLLAQAARDNSLARCAVELSDGQVLADSDPSTKALRLLPETWSAVGDADIGASEHRHVRRIAFEVGGRGRAYLVVAADPTSGAAWAGGGGAMLEFAAIAGLTLSLMAIVVQRAFGTLRPMAAIQSALRASSSGESSVGALTISPRWGPEAAAWNALIAEREALRRGLLERQGPTGGLSARASDTLAERVCDALPQGVLVVDPTLRIRYANGAAGVLLRRKRDALPGKPVSELVLGDRVMEMLRSVAGSGPRRRGCVEVEQTDDGEPSFLRYAASRLGSDGNAAAASGGGGGAPAPARSWSSRT